MSDFLKSGLGIKLSRDFLLFSLLALLVTILQYFLISRQLNYGFMPDDWWPLYDYYIAGNSPLEKFFHIWQANGIYTTYQVYYISILNYFFGFDFRYYQVTNQVLKILATLSLYPLIVFIFKKRLLAFTTVLIYAIHFSPVGTLEITAKGSDFISTIFLSIFLIVYGYYIIKKINQTKKLVYLSILLLIVLATSPIRTYPLILFTILCEGYILLSGKLKDKTILFKRLFVLFLPYLIVFVLQPKVFTRFLLINPPGIIERVSLGNWHMVLTPVISLGSITMTGDLWQLMGRNISIESFSSYFNYLISGPLLFFGILTAIVTIFTKRGIRFFVGVMLLNFICSLLLYPILTRVNLVDPKLKMHFDFGNVHPLLGGLYLLVLAFFFWREWVKDKNLLLMALWTGPIFSFIFIWCTWLLQDFVVVPKGVHSYLAIPAIGVCLFWGSLITCAFYTIRSLRFLKMGLFLSPLIFLIFIFFFYFSYREVNVYIDSFIKNGMDALEQQRMRDDVYSELKGISKDRPSLVFIDSTEDYPNGRFYELSVLARFSRWFYFWQGQPEDICMVPQSVLHDKKLLKSLVSAKGGLVGFEHTDNCGRPTFFPVDNFYALELMNRKPHDIKEQILEEVGISQ